MAYFKWLANCKENDVIRPLSTVLVDSGGKEAPKEINRVLRIVIKPEPVRTRDARKRFIFAKYRVCTGPSMINL